jgi:RNA polymerase sigma-B factor
LQETLTKELDRTPSVTELSQHSGFSVQQICEALQSLEACTHYESFESSDEHVDGDDARALAEIVPDRKYQDFQLAAEDRERVHQALKMLGDKASQMMQFIFFHDLTQKETAERMGVSEMVVSRAVHSSVKKLRDILSTEIV